VVHFDSEDLSSARSGRSVGRDEDNFSTRDDFSLFDTSSDDVSYSLDFVDSRDRHAHSGIGRTRRDLNLFFQDIEDSLDVNLFTGEGLDFESGPPGHVGGRSDKVVSHPSRDRDHRDRFINELLFPSDLDEYVSHFRFNFIVTGLSVFGDVTVHLVDSDKELFDSEQVDEDGVLTSLSLNFTCLVVSSGEGSGKVTVSRNHQKSNISLGSSGKHVLDKVTMSRSVYNSVVLGWGEEFLGCAGNGHTTFTFFLLAVHVESEGERGLSKTVSFFTEFDHFSLRYSTEFEDQTTSGGRLSCVDMSTDYN
jgi:hypothetical protein